MVISAVVLLVTSVLSTQAQNKEDWKERMMSEKIAFLTAELNITPQEAQDVPWKQCSRLKAIECTTSLSPNGPTRPLHE